MPGMLASCVYGFMFAFFVLVFKWVLAKKRDEDLDDDDLGYLSYLFDESEE